METLLLYGLVSINKMLDTEAVRGSPILSLVLLIIALSIMYKCGR